MASKAKATSKASVMLQAVTASTLPPRTVAVAIAPKRPLTEASEPLSKSAAKRAAKRARAAAAMPAETTKQQVSLKDCDAELFGGSGVVRPKYDHVEEVSEEEASAFMKKHEIAIVTTGEAAPRPCTALSGAPFPPPLVKLLLTQGFRAPAAVQAASWPLAMMGRDVLAVAKTGAGKTLGYLLPALTRCHESLARSAGKPSAGKPRCLVMAPTRELVLQIKGQAAKYGAPLGCRAVAVYGGTPKWEQAAEQRPATTCHLGCNHMPSRLQPRVVQAATIGSPGCNRMPLTASRRRSWRRGASWLLPPPAGCSTFWASTAARARAAQPPARAHRASTRRRRASRTAPCSCSTRQMPCWSWGTSRPTPTPKQACA